MIGRGQTVKSLVFLQKSLESFGDYQNVLIKRGMLSDLYMKKFALAVVWRLNWTKSIPMQILINFRIQKNTLSKTKQ